MKQREKYAQVVREVFLITATLGIYEMARRFVDTEDWTRLGMMMLGVTLMCSGVLSMLTPKTRRTQK